MITARQRNELVEALLACSNLSTSSQRDTIMTDLSEHIHGVQRSSVDQEDVANIVRACLNYANGLEWLVAIVRVYEHDSWAMQNVDRLLLHLFDFQIEDEGLGLRILVMAGDVDTPLARLRDFYLDLLPSNIAPREDPVGLFTMLSHLWNLSCKPGAITSQRTFPIVDFVTQLALAAGGRRVAADLRSWADEAQKYLYRLQKPTDSGAAAPATPPPAPSVDQRLAVLASVLASLYPSIEASGELIAAARLNPVNIQFRDLPETNWQNILAEAVRRDRVMAIVDAALADKPGNPWLLVARRELRLGERPAAQSGKKAILEKVISPAPALPTDLSFLEQALARARSVGRVILTYSGGQKAFCTGFLTHGNLLIVPHHCIRSVEEAAAAQVQFNYQRGASDLYAQPEEFGLAPEEAFATSETEQGDWTAVRVRGDPNARYGALNLMPTGPKLKDLVSLIHHAYGAPKQVELLVGAVSWVGTTRLQYTMVGGRPGSSGAPVFDANWAIVGMHRAARPLDNEMVAAEAAHMNAIIEGLKANNLYFQPGS